MFSVESGEITLLLLLSDREIIQREFEREGVG